MQSSKNVSRDRAPVSESWGGPRKRSSLLRTTLTAMMGGAPAFGLATLSDDGTGVPRQRSTSLQFRDRNHATFKFS